MVLQYPQMRYLGIVAVGPMTRGCMMREALFASPDAR
jgi:hypothetical protein